MKTDERNKRELEEAVLLDSFHHELQDPKKLERDIQRLKLEIAKLRWPLNK